MTLNKPQKCFFLAAFFLLAILPSPAACEGLRGADNSERTLETSDIIGPHHFTYDGKKQLEKRGGGIDQDQFTRVEIPEADPGDMLIAIIGTSGIKPQFRESGWTLIGHLSKENDDSKNKYGNCNLYAYCKKYDRSDEGTSIKFKGGNRRFFSVVVVKDVKEVVGFNFGQNLIDLRDHGVDKKGVFSYSAIEGTKEWERDESRSDQEEWSGPVDQWIDNSNFFILASMFDDQVKNRGASIGGKEDTELILYEQHGDDTMIISGKKGEFKSLEDLGDAKQRWENADLNRIHQVYSLNMLIGLK